MASITHATVASGTDSGTGEIHKAEWNAAHTVTGDIALSTSYVGYNTVGGSFETTPNTIKTYAKAITPSGDGILSTIEMYFKGNDTNAGSVGAMVLTDSSGSPGNLVAMAGVGPFTTGTHMLNTFKSSTGVWVAIPVGAKLTGGTTYWMLVTTYDGGAGNGALQVAYDSGTDKTATAQGYYRDVTQTWATGSRSYSIRGLYLAAGVSSGSPILAYKADTSGDHSTGGTSLADVDATNAAVTFTAPASTNVLVRLSGTCGATTTANSYQTWGLREGSTDIAGSVGESIAYRSSGAASEAFAGVTKTFVLTGISAGSHTYKWSYAQSSGTGHLKANSNSPAVMEVWTLS